MSTRIIRDLLILLAVFGVVWAVFTYFPIFPEENPIDLPFDKEEKLGELFLEAYLENETVLDNPLVDSAVYVIKERLIDSIGLTEYDYNVMVVQSEEINAFATFGGNIVVFSGLISFTERPEELAAVIAHEMGHIEHRHVVDRIIKELGIALLFGILTGGDAVLIDEISRTIASTVFDRRQEEEADEFSLALLEKCSLSPRNLGSFFRRLDDKLGGYDRKLEMFMTHPNNMSRIKRSFEYELSEEFEEQPFNLDWDLVKQGAGGYAEY